MSDSRRVSVIIPSYNQPNALSLVLEGLRRQSFLDFELVITDDGSDHDTPDLVFEFAENAPFPVHWVTQEDLGFRKSKALNNGIRRAQGEHLLFLDGDCIPTRDWAKKYLAALEAGADFCVAGYVILPLDETKTITVARVQNGEFESLATFSRRVVSAANHWKQCLYILLRTKGRPHFLGGNWAATRSAVEGVNGFDENYEHFGREDSDIRNRLVNAGYRPVSLFNRNWVFHCNHGIDPRRTDPKVVRGASDVDYYNSRKDAVRCERGLRSAEQDSDAQESSREAGQPSDT